MAVTPTKVVAKFSYATDDGSSATVTIQNADVNAESSYILAAGQAFITNNAIFDRKYTTLKSAKIVQTSEEEFVQS